jgi:hypothetical protein
LGKNGAGHPPLHGQQVPLRWPPKLSGIFCHEANRIIEQPVSHADLACPDVCHRQVGLDLFNSQEVERR